MTPTTGDDARSEPDRDDRGTPGALTRVLWLGPAAALLAVRLFVTPRAAYFGAGFAAAGFGLIVVAGALHILALRWPHRYAVNGAAWVTTVVALFAALTIAIAGGE